MGDFTLIISLLVPDHPHIQQTYVDGQEPGNLFFGLTVGEVGEVGEVNSDTVDRYASSSPTSSSSNIFLNCLS